MELTIKDIRPCELPQNMKTLTAEKAKKLLSVTHAVADGNYRHLLSVAKSMSSLKEEMAALQETLRQTILLREKEKKEADALFQDCASELSAMKSANKRLRLRLASSPATEETQETSEVAEELVTLTF